MSSVSVIFGTTNTLPVGTPSHTFERVYQRSYKPFLRLLYNTPGFPLTMHFSGTMLSWLDSAHSEFTDVLGEMTQRRQVELIGGAFYDPVFSLIPAKDRLGQVESLTTLIRRRFGRRPRGAWITEQVWEPSLASTLRNSGIEYAFLDDYNLIAGGAPADELHMPCLTEDQGKTLLVFPTRASLLARIGVNDPADMIEELSRIAREQPGSVVSLMFDGTRYGTAEDKGAHEERWLERFIGHVNDNSDWIAPTTPWRYTRRAAVRKRYYFPVTSFEEMMVWSMEPERQRCLLGIKEKLHYSREENGYLAGGYFRQFLTRYVESNLLYSKMQYTCVLVNQIRGDKYRKQAARHELWKGQCHQAYWHGRPGGIYQNNLRKAAYSSLIEAEKVTREKGIFIPSIVKVDFDMDGLDEYLFQGQELNAYVHHKSGALFELDYLARPWNYLDSFTRRPERYHEDYDETPPYDRYWRKAFIDHLLSDTATIDEFEHGRFDTLADLPSQYYEVPRYEREGGELGLETEAQLPDGGRVAVRKEYTFERSKVVARITVSNSGRTTVKGWYGCEVNLSFASEDVDTLRVHVLPEADPASARKNMARKLLTGREPADASVSEINPEKQVFSGVGTVVFEDLKNQVDLSVSMFESVECWSLPLRTRSLGDNGLTTTYQSSCLLPRWRLSLEPQQQSEFYLELRINGE
ncbi:MAG: alpha-amylase/4-alpha-glucanotransferase domain-containing protein [Spirochaetia bacterium]